MLNRSLKLLFALALAISFLPLPVSSFASCGGIYYSNDVPPPNIRVYMTGNGQVVTYNFNYYVRNVLPNEWITGWPQNSLRAGAIAVKDYAWYFVNNGPWLHSNGLCYDVDDTTSYQRFIPNSSTSTTDQAVNASWNWLGRKSGAVILTQYKSGNPTDSCGQFNGGPAPGNEMSQNGTNACAIAGYGWQQVVSPVYYFPNVALVQSLGSNYSWYLRNSNSGGPADIAFQYGQAGDLPVVGDWTGQGFMSPGVYRDGAYYLRNHNNAGGADIAFYYGQSGDVPVVGDWTGQGKTTIGVFRNGYWYLRNSNTTGQADISFQYGLPGDLPLVGDWTGKINPSTGFPIDTIGIVRNGVFYLRNSNTSGAADIAFAYQSAGDTPVVGDWIGQGTSTPGTFRDGTWLERNSNSSGSANTTFSFGTIGDTPLSGNWVACSLNCSITDTPGIAR